MAQLMKVALKMVAYGALFRLLSSDMLVFKGLTVHLRLFPMPEYRIIQQ